MPKIYEYLGFVFFFYANEHLPIHVHVSQGDCESQIELIFEEGSLKDCVVKAVTGRKSLVEKDLREALKFVQHYAAGIVTKWTDFFVMNKKVRCETIRQKL